MDEQVVGFYYALTRRAPSDVELKYFTQGIAKVGGLIVILTASAQEQSADAFRLAVQMVTTARQIVDQATSSNHGIQAAAQDDAHD